MEVSLSFDNAVVNASVLKTWNDYWKKLFLAVGIIVAVFGMRLLFPSGNCFTNCRSWADRGLEFSTNRSK